MRSDYFKEVVYRIIDDEKVHLGKTFESNVYENVFKEVCNDNELDDEIEFLIKEKIYSLLYSQESGKENE